MQTVPCPQGDGTGTIPDPAVVARDGQLVLMALADVERLLPTREIDASRLRLLPSRHSAAELTPLADGDDARGVVVAREILQGAESQSAVIVHCTCGHLYVLDT